MTKEMYRRQGAQLRLPSKNDPRDGMYRVEEAWKYRLAQRVYGLRMLEADGEGISQHELARRARVSQTTITHIERGDGCSLDALVRVAQALSVSTDFLLGFQKIPYNYQDLVDQAYTRIMSIASSLDFVEEQGLDMTIRSLIDHRDMLRRVTRDFVDLAFRFKYPDQEDLSVRTPYGYEFLNQIRGEVEEDELL